MLKLDLFYILHFYRLKELPWIVKFCLPKKTQTNPSFLFVRLFAWNVLYRRHLYLRIVVWFHRIISTLSMLCFINDIIFIHISRDSKLLFQNIRSRIFQQIIVQWCLKINKWISTSNYEPCGGDKAWDKKKSSNLNLVAWPGLAWLDPGLERGGAARSLVEGPAISLPAPD